MLKCHTNATAKPPKGSRGKSSGPRQLSLWGSTARTVSKTAKELDNFVSRGAVASHCNIKGVGLNHPVDVMEYFVVRGLDDKG